MIKQTTFLFIFSILFIGCTFTKPQLPKEGEYLLFKEHKDFTFKTTSFHNSKQFYTLQDLQKISHLYIDMINSSNLTSNAFYSNEQKVLEKNCSKLSSYIYEENPESLLWQQTCDNRLTNKSSFSIYKTYKTTNNFYIVKRRWIDFQPDLEAIEDWLEYLNEVEIYNNKL